MVVSVHTPGELPGDIQDGPCVEGNGRLKTGEGHFGLAGGQPAGELPYEAERGDHKTSRSLSNQKLKSLYRALQGLQSCVLSRWPW